MRAHLLDARTVERFWRYVRKSDGCWLWTGTIHAPGGYGKLSVGGKWREFAHRVSWFLHNGEPAAGMFVCHRCDTPLCVRPDHLFLGTHRDNMADCKAKGRNTHQVFRGARHPLARLTDAKVLDIRRRCGGGEDYGTAAAEFGVTRGYISDIVTRRRWGHLP